MHQFILTPGRRALLAGLLCAVIVAAVAPVGRLALTLPLLLIGPGYLIERAVFAHRLHISARLAIWMGLSISLTALLYLWLTIAGLALTDPLLWGMAGLLTLATLAAAWHDLGGAAPHTKPLPLAEAGEFPPPLPRAAARGATFLLIAIFAITLWVRFVQIENLALPAWVDSVHHSLLVKVAVENSQAPLSLRPYLPVDDLPYHWGYHVFTATLMRLSGLDLISAILLPGQILNALCGLAVAGLATYLWRRPLAGVGAALVVGLISIMPAYYVSWGRYTQLTGLLMLPSLAIAWGEALRVSGRGRWVIFGLLLAGISLVHVRVLIFGLALLVAQALIWAVGRPWPELRGRLMATVAAGVGTLVITAPWIWLLVRRALLPALETSGGLEGGGSYNALSTGLLWSLRNQWLIGLALLGAWLGLRRRIGAPAVLLIWVALLAIQSNPWLLVYITPGGGVLVLLLAIRRRNLPTAIIGLALLLINPFTVVLPYLWLITSDVVAISLFVPLGVLIGGGVALVFERLSVGRPRLAMALFAALTLALAGWGAYDRRVVINQTTVLAMPADREAIAWVAANTSADARFLVNSTAWLGPTRRGSDGGWWLLPLAGRQTTTPPVLYTYGDPAYVRHVQEVAEVVVGYKPGNEQAIFDLIAREGIGYIYLGPVGGPLSPAIFADQPGFQTVYAQDGVTIIAVGDS
jgi:hypothetical protein